MGKKWQEIEFLDYKERQIRRRSQRTRALQLRLETEQTATRGLKVVLAAAVLLVGISISFVVWRERLKAFQAALFGGRSTLTITEVVGRVEVATSTRNATEVKIGDTVKEDVTITVPDGGRCTLGTFWKNSRITLTGHSSLEISKIVLLKEDPDAFLLKMNGKIGVVIVEFRTGFPRVEVRTPQGAIVRASLGQYKVIFEEKESAVSVRDGFVVVSPQEGADKSKRVRVLTDERLVMRRGELDKAVPYPLPETAWR